MGDFCVEQVPIAAGGDELRPWRNVPRRPTAPFVHRFRTQRQTYVYDVNTRRILRVSPVLWDVLGDYDPDDADSLADQEVAHGPEEVRKAVAEIESAQARGLMLANRPSRMEPPAEREVRRMLDEQRQQLILNVTEDCNFRCTYCVYGGSYEHHRTHAPRAMEWSIAEPAIDDFLEHAGGEEEPSVTFYGGEPLLNMPLIRRCVEHARRQHPDGDVRFSLTTNASLLAGETAEYLAGEGFHLVVSLDGPASIHDRSRRTADGEPTWSRVFGNVRRFLEKFPEYSTNGHLRFNAVVTPEADLCAAEAFWASRPEFDSSMGVGISEQQRTDDEPPLDSSDPLLRTAEALHREFVEAHAAGTFGAEHDAPRRWVQAGLFQRRLMAFHKRGYLSKPLPESMSVLSTCVPGARRTFVSVDGDYYACERVVHTPAQRIGNVASGVDVERVLELLEQWTGACAGDCPHCWAVSHCMAGCLAMMQGDGTITESAKADLCAKHRRSLHGMLAEYCGILERNSEAFAYVEQYELS